MLQLAINPDYGFRYERKFFISGMSRPELQSLIRSNIGGFSEIFFERKINNIYLDSLDFDNYFDNVGGSSERLKARIRWYGESFGTIERPVLEIKMKNGELGTKLSFPLKSFKFDGSFSSGRLKNVFDESGIPHDVLCMVKGFEPSLFNNYTRRYFMSRDKKYRLTIDYDLEFYNVRRKYNLFMDKRIDKDNLIVELKYDAGGESSADTITNDFPFRMTKSSKYIRGRDILSQGV